MSNPQGEQVTAKELEKAFNELKLRYKETRHPSADDFLLVNFYENDKVIERNLNLRALHLLLKKKMKSLGGDTPLVLVCSNPKKQIGQWVEFWPKDALDNQGWRVESLFLEKEYKQACSEHGDVVNSMVQELKQILLKFHDVEGHAGADKCWDLSCMKSKSNDFDSLKDNFEEFVMLLV